ncbi:MAG: 3'(2'),5'-bisphosphate nucleotidase CysQ [Gammaproteobacteria bacterium]|nr:3'(2'),5'-bisphosphate nucleotidase CysQ [Gammaproteobacteria bacterium]
MRSRLQNSEIKNLLPAIIDLAKRAGEHILQVYKSEFEVTEKEDRSPLTEADLAAHNCIVAGLESLTPDIPVLSEESAKIPFSERQTWNRYWLVDPLDGTREFIKRNGEFTVNIALIDNHESVLGVIYVPVQGFSYYAARGEGAFKQSEGEAPAKISSKKWEGGTLKVAGSRSHRCDSLDSMLEKIGDYEIISMGSSLKSCLVAEGVVHIYPRFGPTSEWDTAAAQCVVEEAGGRITEMSFKPLRYNTKDSLLNPWFFVAGDQDIDWQQYIPDDDVVPLSRQTSKIKEKRRPV